MKNLYQRIFFNQRNVSTRSSHQKGGYCAISSIHLKVLVYHLVNFLFLYQKTVLKCTHFENIKDVQNSFDMVRFSGIRVHLGLWNWLELSLTEFPDVDVTEEIKLKLTNIDFISHYQWCFCYILTEYIDFYVCIYSEGNCFLFFK